MATETLQNISKSWFIREGNGRDENANETWFPTVDGDALSLSLMQASHQGNGANDEPLNRVVKLLAISAIALVASVGNIFIISTILMEDHLKKRGLKFLFCFIVPKYYCYTKLVNKI